jgi:general secretion pathway protein D
MKLIKFIFFLCLFLECFSEIKPVNKLPDKSSTPVKEKTNAVKTSTNVATVATSSPTDSSVKNTQSQQSNEKKSTAALATKDSDSENNPNLVSLNFENADVQSVIKAISKLSGKNFVIDSRVKGTINIVSEKPIAKADSYKVLEAALRMQGFATIEANGVIKVLPENEAKTYGMKVISNKNSTHGDQFLTKIFVIDKVPVAQITNSIKPMVGNNSIISTYGPANCLIISDYQSNMDRITSIIDSLVNTSRESLTPVVIHLEYVLASDAMQTLQPYLNGNSSSASGNSGGSAVLGGGAGSDSITVSVIPDNNTNSLIVTSSSPAKLNEIKSIIRLIDVKSKDNNNNYHIIYLKNADAAHIADVLRTIAYGQEDPDLQSMNSNRYISDSSSMFQAIGGSAGSTSSPFSDSSKSSGKHEGSKSPGGGGSSGQDKNAAKIFIQAEPTVNALIIEAPDPLYRRLRHMIELLDVRRAQIMIEALIVDVNMTDAGSFGIQWAAVVPGGAGLASYASATGGGVAPGAASLTQTLMGGAAAQKGDYKGIAGLDNNVYIGLVSGQTTVGGKKIPSVAALADMLATNTQANLLGRPTILTLDNEEANIMVGNNIGIPNGTYQSSANSTGGLNTTFSRVDLGTSLKIKPLIIEDGTILLSIFQEDSKVIDYNPPSGAGPTFGKRNLKTEILVSDGQMIAIGGMLSDENNIIKQGIPGLMDIPYLGWLFSWQGRQHVKKSMFVFLRPVIVRNTYGVQALTNEKYQYIMGQEKEVHAENNIMLPRINGTTMDNQVPWTKNPPPKGQSRDQYMNDAIKNDKDGIIDLRNVKSDSKMQNKPPASETVLK